MKLYVIDKENKNKITLDVLASNKAELRRLLGSDNFVVKNKYYTIDDVKAAYDSSETVAGILIGSVLGLLVGPIGPLVGGIIGGFVGEVKVNEQKVKAKKFNKEIF